MSGLEDRFSTPRRDFPPKNNSLTLFIILFAIASWIFAFTIDFANHGWKISRWLQAISIIIICICVASAWKLKYES